MGNKWTHDIIILGGGAAGLSTASGCAQLGMKTLLIEPNKTGGDCLYHGCVPSKTLIRSAAAAQAVMDWQRFGVSFPSGPLAKVPNPEWGLADPGPINDRINKVIQTIEPHDSPERFRNLGAEVIQESAVFVDPYTVETSSGKRFTSRKIVLATGSRPRIIPLPGLEEAGYLTNLNMFSLKELPQSLIVLGGGPIGIELSQSMARLGVKVTIVEAAHQILPREDNDMASIIHQKLESEGITILTNAMGESVEKTESEKNTPEKTLILKGGKRISAQELLVAIGRIGNTENLAIENAGATVEKGFFRVDNRLRTSKKHILAIGDCNGQYLFTPVAGAEGSLAVRTFALGLPGKISYKAVPWVTYSEPELASVGLNEKSAVQLGYDIRVLRVPMNSVDRALAEGEDTGMTKLILDRKDRVIGVQILGPHAGEMLLPGIFAVKEQWKVSRFLSPLYPYPTVSEVYKKAAGAHLGPKLFNPRVKAILRFFKGYRGK